MCQDSRLEQVHTGALKIIFIPPFTGTNDKALKEAVGNAESAGKRRISYISFDKQPLRVYIESVLQERGFKGRDFHLRQVDLAKGELVVEADLTPRHRQ